jgi:hypothetical protein
MWLNALRLIAVLTAVAALLSAENPRLATTTAGNKMHKMKSLATKTGLVLAKILMSSSVALGAGDPEAGKSVFCGPLRSMPCDGAG